MSSTFPSVTPLNPQPPRRLDYSQLYENIGNLVIEKAHSGDPLFQWIFEWAWKKTFNMNENKAGSTGAQPTEPARDVTDTIEVKYSHDI